MGNLIKFFVSPKKEYHRSASQLPIQIFIKRSIRQGNRLIDCERLMSRYVIGRIFHKRLQPVSQDFRKIALLPVHLSVDIISEN